MQTPFISIIIPTLNEEKFLPQLLKSLSLQTSKNFEVIVVDGQSSDKTITKAKAYTKKLPYFEVMVADHAGVSHQRNMGVKKAQGTWLVFVDADSVLLSYFIERIELFIKRHKPTIFTTWCQPDSEVANDALIALLANMTIEGSLILKRPFAPGPLSIVKREVFEMVGGYDETLSYMEDYDFSAKVYEKGFHMKILRESLFKWSLRRIRNEGRMNVFRTYARSALWVLISKRGPRNMPGYLTGGHLYDKDQKIIEPSRLKQYEQKLKNLIREFFE